MSDHMDFNPHDQHIRPDDKCPIYNMIFYVIFYNIKKIELKIDEQYIQQYVRKSFIIK